MEDGQIIQLYCERNEQALKETADKYGAYIRKIASNILGNREDTEECENEVLLRAWNTIPPQSPKSLAAYLAVLTREISIDRFRRTHRQKRGGTEYDQSYEELSEVLAGKGSEAEEITGRIALGGLMNRYLSGRPKDVRDILIMRYFYLDSVKEIAEWTGSSEARIKTLLHRERKSLKEFLEKEGYEL